MDDLVTWLRARLDEDERVARAEVKAKRELLDCLVGATGRGTSRLVADGEPWAIDSDHLVKLLARPYAGRDGWREEWRL